MSESGIPIGSSLIKNGELVASGHNKRVQEDKPILHGKIDYINNAGRVGSFRFETKILVSCRTQPFTK